MKPDQRARAVQYFSNEYLEYCKTLTPVQILNFIDQFQRLHLARELNADRNSSKPSDKRHVKDLRMDEAPHENEFLRLLRD